MEAIGGTILWGVIIIVGIIYSVIIYKILHGMFDYVYFGHGFFGHLIGIFGGGLLLSTLTASLIVWVIGKLWKIVAVVVAIAGMGVVLSQKEVKKELE